MLKYAGEMVRIAREECGMSKSSFVKNAKTVSISRKTLTRIEEGDTSVKSETVKKVLAYFGIEDLYILRDEHEDALFRKALTPCFDGCLRERIVEVKADIYEYRCLFFAEKSSLTFPIDTLAKLLLYLPFFNEFELCDVVRRIGGDFTRQRGIYALEMLRGLYRHLPNSKEKRAADSIAKSIDSMDVLPPEEALNDYTIMVEKKCKRLENAL